MGSDEARRRLALSLAIGRDRKGALDALQPLLNRRDQAAQRTRAFVLALVGDKAAATQAIESVMPGASARFEPFFRYLPNLSTVEKAAAVHLGIFPDDASTRVASIDVAPVQPQVAVRTTPPPAVAVRTTPPVRQARNNPPAASTRESGFSLAGRGPVRTSTSRPVATPVRTPAPPPSAVAPTSVASSSSFNLPSASGAVPTASSTEAPVQSAPPPAEVVQKVEPAFSIADNAAAEGRLSGIDKLLATIVETPPAPPAPKPKVESRRADSAAATKSAAERKKREEKLAADRKAKEEAARLGVAGTHWVQLAGGAHASRMATEYKRLSSKAGSLLKSRSGYVTEGVDYFRLLVGPFASKTESQAFVNKLAKEGVDGFSWTRTPPKIKIEKLSSP
jgi:hypothetical protein